MGVEIGGEVKTEADINGGTDRSASDGDNEGRRASTVARRTSGPTRRSTKGNWTPEEDAILSEAVKQYNGKNWKCIAGLLKDRSDFQCLHRWQKVLNPELIKGSWTKEEDALIIDLVNKHGSKHWSMIARSLSGRIGKQCRERWYNHLNPEIKKDAWTEEEEITLICAHKAYGNKWAEISKFLPGRSDNSIKNHWNCSLKKRCGQDMPNLVLEIDSFDLNNYGLEAKRQKADPEMRSNRSPNHKLDGDCYSPTPEVSSVEHASTGRQDQNFETSSIGDSTCLAVDNQPLNGPEDDIRTAVTEKYGNFVPSCCRPLQVEDTTDSVLEEKFSRPEDFSIHYSTPPDLSPSPVYIPSSPISILRRAAERFETPSIIKRRNQSCLRNPSEKAKHVESIPKNESSHQGATNNIATISRNDPWSAEEFFHLSRDYLSLGNFGTKFVGKRLEAEFDSEWNDTSRQ